MRLQREERPRRDEARSAARWDGKLLLLHPDAARSGAPGLVTLLAAAPAAAAAGVLRGIDLLSPTGKTVREVTRPEYQDDFAPRLDVQQAFLGGSSEEGRCGFLALSTLAGLPSTQPVLGGALHLTDLQLDFVPGGAGPALSHLKRALGEAAPPAVRMLMGCRAWPDLEELDEQLELGLWRLVDVVDGRQKLAAALMSTQEGRGASLALWEALWNDSEEQA